LGGGWENLLEKETGAKTAGTRGSRDFELKGFNRNATPLTLVGGCEKESKKRGRKVKELYREKNNGRSYFRVKSERGKGNYQSYMTPGEEQKSSGATKGGKASVLLLSAWKVREKAPARRHCVNGEE